MDNSQRRFESWMLIPTLLFLVLVIVFSGGMCERYERKMNRRENMKNYYDSLRTVEQLQKDSIHKAEEEREKESKQVR